MSAAEIKRLARADIDAGAIPEDFWDKALMIEPESSQQITLHLPRRILRHCKANREGYQTRISSILTRYGDAERVLG